MGAVQTRDRRAATITRVAGDEARSGGGHVAITMVTYVVSLTCSWWVAERPKKD